MNLSRYLEICKEIEKLEHATEEKKRLSYTAGNDDVLHNFNDDAEFVGNSPLQNVLTHLMKQIRAISSYVKNPGIEPSETLLSRVVDVRVYSKLLVAVAVEMGRPTGIMNTPADYESELQEFQLMAANWPDNKRATEWTDCPYPQPPLPKGMFTGGFTGPFDYHFGKGDEEPWKD